MLIERQRESGEIVSRHNVSRLVETLHDYFRCVGRPKTREKLTDQVERFIQEHSLPDAEGISPTRLPVTVDVPLLDELRVIDQEMRARFVDWHGRPASLHALGLGLDKNLDDHRYGHCTPLNCRTFAGTGGDGHHFSFLVIDGAITESSPIVATAPDSFGNPSAVIADSLHQFLRLGCINGYGPLGWAFLHSDDEKLSKHFISANDPSAEEFSHLTFQRDMLAYLRQRLNLEPWTDWQASRAIQHKYQPVLRHPPDAIF
jgi:hypothetical protein